MVGKDVVTIKWSRKQRVKRSREKENEKWYRAVGKPSTESQLLHSARNLMPRSEGRGSGEDSGGSFVPGDSVVPVPHVSR